MKNYGMDLTEQGRKEIISLHVSLAEYLEFLYPAIGEGNSVILTKAISENSAIRHKIKNYRASHLNRLAAEQTSPMMSLIYMDLLNSYRRMLDHAFNIAEVLCGVK